MRLPILRNSFPTYLSERFFVKFSYECVECDKCNGIGIFQSEECDKCDGEGECLPPKGEYEEIHLPGQHIIRRIKIKKKKKGKNYDNQNSRFKESSSYDKGSY